MIDEFDVVALRVPLPMRICTMVAMVCRQATRARLWMPRPMVGISSSSLRDDETVAIETVTPDQVRLVQRFRPAPKHTTVKA